MQSCTSLDKAFSEIRSSEARTGSALLFSQLKIFEMQFSYWSILTNESPTTPKVSLFFNVHTWSICPSRYFPGCVQRISTHLCWHTWQRLLATPSPKSYTRSPPTDLPPSWPPITCLWTSSAGARKEPRPARFTPQGQTHTYSTQGLHLLKY